MPVIARFYGIAILMFFQDHHPPHFHAKYEGQLGVFTIKGCRLIAGKVPPRAGRLVKEWAKIHEKELMEDWHVAQKSGKLKMIEPLI
jgi:hypothetical protein